MLILINIIYDLTTFNLVFFAHVYLILFIFIDRFFDFIVEIRRRSIESKVYFLS